MFDYKVKLVNGDLVTIRDHREISEFSGILVSHGYILTGALHTAGGVEDVSPICLVGSSVMTIRPR